MYPVGVFACTLDGATPEFLGALSADFGVVVEPGVSLFVDLGSATVRTVPDVNLWPAFSAGFGLGLVCFGFGWNLRLTKRITDF